MDPNERLQPGLPGACVRYGAPFVTIAHTYKYAWWFAITLECKLAQSHVWTQMAGLHHMDEIMAMIRSKKAAQGPPRGLAGVLKKQSARSGAAQSMPAHPEHARPQGVQAALKGLQGAEVTAFRREAEDARARDAQARDREQKQRDAQWQLRFDKQLLDRDEMLQASLKELKRVYTSRPLEEETALRTQSVLSVLAPSSRPSRPAPPNTARVYASMTTMQGVENVLGSNYMERLAQEVRPRSDDAHHLFIGEEQLSYSIPNENQQWHRALCNHEGLRKEFASFKGVASTSDVTKWLRDPQPPLAHLSTFSAAAGARPSVATAALS